MFFFDLCFDDHGSRLARNLSIGSVRPRHLFDQYFDDDYFFKLPLQGAGCPIMCTVFYFAPCPVPSCPAYKGQSTRVEEPTLLWCSNASCHLQWVRVPSTERFARKAVSDRPALKPYWGKPAVRNFREGHGNVGIIRSPLRAFALPDQLSGQQNLRSMNQFRMHRFLAIW